MTHRFLLPLTLIALVACNGEGKDEDTGETDDTQPTDDTPDETGGDTDETDLPPPMPRGSDAPPTLGTQIDRAGRPAISTALVQTFGTAMDRDMARVDYNRSDLADGGDFRADFIASLAIYDGLDTVCGDQLVADLGTERYGFLADVLTDDQLYVLTTTGTCGVYLGLEGEIVGELEAGEGGCGGRMPGEDVIERSYSVLASGLLAGIDDGIPADDVAPSTTFPFLVAPE